MPPSGSNRVELPIPNHALDVDEVAEIVNVCAATVRREAKRGNLRGIKVGHVWRFMPDDLRAYLDSDTPAAAAERTGWDARIREMVDNAPPLTPAQVSALSALFDWQPGGAA
ncbi:helix-turn-helix domain-containing protein [Mycolicibacterium porcinum]|uniref:helix-turn-helix domain-containing protein n=1 Tax=Mycolicibacterium porcinum TaxID=39693 RepID=UPI0031F7BA9B